jgi:hypothetical protein
MPRRGLVRVKLSNAGSLPAVDGSRDPVPCPGLWGAASAIRASRRGQTIRVPAGFAPFTGRRWVLEVRDISSGTRHDCAREAPRTRLRRLGTDMRPQGRRATGGLRPAALAGIEEDRMWQVGILVAVAALLAVELLWIAMA